MIRLLHRGNTFQYIENTFLALKTALKKKNFNGFETDIRLTKDKKWIVFHDDNLERLCNINKKINELNYNMLPLINNKYKIIQLKDLLIFSSYDKYINLEIKEPFRIDIEAKKNLLNIIKQFEINIIISSFYWEWYNFFKNENINFAHLIEQNFLPNNGIK